MKPILKYRGGKSKEIQFFNHYIPQDFKTYYEPFFGGGSVYFYLEPQRAKINDVNSRLINFYRSVSEDYDTLRNELSEIQQIYEANRKIYEERKLETPELRVEDDNEPFYYELRDMYNHLIPQRYSDAALYYFINKTSYSGMIRYNNKGEFNVPYGRYKNFNTQLLTRGHSELLQRAEINNKDYSNLFNEMTENDFMFLDPPYDTTFSDYGNIEFTGDFDEEHHRRLALDFRNLTGNALLIIGSTPLIEELYRPFIRERYQKSYAVNIRNRFRSESEHLIITNYTI
ncbi:Dam family site-specific DNA-(adenine-N6)-methyltransferase [Bacillus sp. JCM 19034]|uniref:DNA adenine methylase n=1 Tax=Bacillus sp. JCM 19034 TaxID=1481928 RepID=UPI000786297D|nr:Dam family site-specific DNA-(adenine-N6)-methyltransferase [Bacillus sp. JCM 19034]